MTAGGGDVVGEIERLVLVDDQCVTYKWLAYEHGMPMKEARAALLEFVEARSADAKKRSLATYVLTGRVKGSKVAHSVKIVSESKLEETKAKMESVLSEHIYAVQPAVDSDVSAVLANATSAKICDLLNSDDSVSKDLIENRLGAVSFSGRGGIGNRRVVAEPPRLKTFTRPAGEPSAAAAFKRMNSKGSKKAVSSKDFFKKKKPAPATTKSEKPKAEKAKTKPKPASDNAGKAATSSSSLSSSSSSSGSKEIEAREPAASPASKGHKTARDEDGADDVDTIARKKPKVFADDSDDDLELDDVKSDENSASEKDTAKISDTKDKEEAEHDVEMKDTSSDDEAERIARQREALANEEAEERAREKAKRREAEREAKQQVREEEKRKKEEAAKARGRERLGVQITKSGEEKGATRKVKKRRVVKETVEDDEGFLVVRERVIEEEVDEPIPESSAARPSSSSSTSDGAGSASAASSSTRKAGTKPKQLTLSSMFKKKA